MRKFIVAFIAFITTVTYTSCYILFLNTSYTNVFNQDDYKESGPANSIYVKKEAALLNFIEKRMMGKDGQIYTNMKLSARSEGTLSESVGLLMNYCVLRDRKDLFDKELNYLTKKLIASNYLIRWKASKENATCNAAIDDLRIIRALLDAHGKWGDKVYLDTAGFIQEGIYKKQVDGDCLYEFYDWKADKSKRSIPLCYLDLYTMTE